MKKFLMVRMIEAFFLGMSLTQLSYAEETDLIQLMTDDHKVKELTTAGSLQTQIEEMIEAKKAAIREAILAEAKEDTKKSASGKDEVMDELQRVVHEAAIDDKIASRLKAYLDTKNDQGKTAILMAAEQGSIDAVAVLNENGANVLFSQEKEGPTALDIIYAKWPIHWPKPWFESKEKHVPFSQLQRLMRLRAQTRIKPNKTGDFNTDPNLSNVSSDLIAHITKYLTKDDLFNLRGANRTQYCHLSDPSVIDYASDGRADWKIFEKYDPEKFLITPGQSFWLMIPDFSSWMKPWKPADAMLFLDNENFQKRATALSITKNNYYDTSWKIDSDIVKKLSALQSLTNLTLQMLTEEGVNQLLDNENLQTSLTTLAFGIDYKTDLPDLNKISKFQSLKSLSLDLPGSNASLDRSVSLFQTIGQLPQLESLSIGPLPRLNLFSFSNPLFDTNEKLQSFLGNAQLQAQLKHLQLQWLNRWFEFDEDAWRDLSKFKKLESLFLDINRLDVPILIAICRQLQLLENLTKLGMNVTALMQNLGDHYSELVEAVNQNRNLTNLSFKGILRDEFFHQFADHLSEENNIQKLILTGLYNTNEDGLLSRSSFISGIYFINFLKKIKKLNHLELKDTLALYKSTVLEMIELFKPNPSMQYLSLPENNFSTIGTPSHEKFRHDDKDILEALTQLKEKRPHMKIIFGEVEFQPPVRRSLPCNSRSSLPCNIL